MTWVRIDDGFYDNLTNRALGSAARDLFIASLTYCAKGLTDGRLPKTDVPLVLAQAQAKSSVAGKLVAAGRWIDHGDHYEVAEYLTYNPSRDKVEADREATAERQKRWRESRRDKRVTNTVSNGVSNAYPDPTRPLPLSSTYGSKSARPPANPEEDLKTACRHVAERKLALRHQRGETPPTDPEAWLSKVAATDEIALRSTFIDLRRRHPDWTYDQLADELDPDSAPVHPNTRALQTAQAEAEQRDAEAAARAEADPVTPEAITAARQAIRR